MSFDIFVHGQGAVGRCVALLLAQQGWRVGCSEMGASDASEDIRAYAINAASRALLQGLNAWPHAQATPVQAMQVFHDEAVLNFAQPQGDNAMAWIVPATAIEQQLHQAVAQFQSSAQGHLLTTAALSRTAVAPTTDLPDAALHIIAEGKHSGLRAQLGVQWISHSYGQVALATQLRCAKPHVNTARQWFVAGVHGLEVIGLLPQRDNTLSLVWSVPTAGAAALQAMSPIAFAQRLELICGHQTGGLIVQSALQSWPLRVAQASSLCGSMPFNTAAHAQDKRAWALLGDAARSLHPLAGQGLNQGLADVADMCTVLHALRPTHAEAWRGTAGLHSLRVLRRYERPVALRSRLWLDTTDGLFQLFAAPHAWQQALRDWGMRGLDTRVGFKQRIQSFAAGKQPNHGLAHLQ